MKASEQGLNGVQNGPDFYLYFLQCSFRCIKISAETCKYYIRLAFIFQKEKKKTTKKNQNERTKQCQTLQEKLNK